MGQSPTEPGYKHILESKKLSALLTWLIRMDIGITNIVYSANIWKELEKADQGLDLHQLSRDV